MTEIKIQPLRTRRFEMADLTAHGKWLLPRLQLSFPLMTERGGGSWLQSIIYSNEYLFLFAEHACALAQVISAHTLQPKPMVFERFVWVENKDDPQQIADAAQFYTHFHVWAQHLGCDVMIVEELTDVPHDMIKEKIGRIFIRQQSFAKV